MPRRYEREMAILDHMAAEAVLRRSGYTLEEIRAMPVDEARTRAMLLGRLFHV